jgi:hypothetical protein
MQCSTPERKMHLAEKLIMSILKASILPKIYCQ